MPLTATRVKQLLYRRRMAESLPELERKVQVAVTLAGGELRVGPYEVRLDTQGRAAVAEVADREEHTDQLALPFDYDEDDRAPA